MKKEKEKKVAYESLVELTKQSDPEVYFSKFKILEHIKYNIEKKMDCNIHYRTGHKLNTWKNEYGRLQWKDETIDLEDILPKIKTLPIALEELVEEGKAKKIMVVDQRWGENPPYTFDNTNTFFYRAILGGKNVDNKTI
ncbi:MAG: hypothetical protein ACP5NZ_00090 [Nanobdellota archaeon]